ncbi:MAG: YigZ family protein [Desulfovibrio sp.]|jgi:uncharacterized YigZ family protein|nr:YigZ family protein [Desulfovibrio sp.]
MSDSIYPIPEAAPDDPHCSEIAVRRSRFLAACAHTPDAASARAFVEERRGLHPEATHHCWAYVAGPPGGTAHMGASDDGEPHGTAGRPMLNILLHCGVGELCVVVSRWFGGVKLGTGGLARAYQEAVRENLAGLSLTERAPLTRLSARLAYAHLDGLYRLLPRFRAKITALEHGTDVAVRLALPRTLGEEFTQAVAGLTNGAAVLTAAPDE